MSEATHPSKIISINIFNCKKLDKIKNVNEKEKI